MKSAKTFDISQFRNFAIWAAVLLAGCASTPPAPQRVEVPVIVPCISAVPVRPAYEFDRLSAKASDGEMILSLVRDWASLRLYSSQLEAALRGCY